jgi:hypothetical protein
VLGIVVPSGIEACSMLKMDHTQERTGGVMREQRRHQRIRFNSLPLIRLGQFGCAGTGSLENLSLSGLMLRSALPLRVNEPVGCEFSVFGSPLIDIPAVIVSRLGDLFGARFQVGPLSQCLIQFAIDNALASGRASTLSINDVQGRKIMRITGGLNAGLRNDFMHGVAKVGVSEIDLSEVTDIDNEGLDLCRLARTEHQIPIVRPSACVRTLAAGSGSLAGLL